MQTLSCWSVYKFPIHIATPLSYTHYFLPNSIILQRFLNLGNPVAVRFWEENKVPQDQLNPNRATALSVETTVYILLITLLRGDTTYAKPIIQWLTDDQRYGGGFHSTQVHTHSKKKMHDMQKKGRNMACKMITWLKINNCKHRPINMTFCYIQIMPSIT